MSTSLLNIFQELGMKSYCLKILPGNGNFWLKMVEILESMEEEILKETSLLISVFQTLLLIQFFSIIQYIKQNKNQIWKL